MKGYQPISVASGPVNSDHLLFTVLAYFQYRKSRQYGSISTPEELIERASYMDASDIKWNGNNLCTILSIQRTADAFYQQQLERLGLAVEYQRAAKILQKRENPA